MVAVSQTAESTGRRLDLSAVGPDHRPRSGHSAATQSPEPAFFSRLLVAWIFNSPQKSAERFEDFFRSFRPDEWPGVFVPSVHPGEDILFELPNRFVHPAAQELPGQKPEPALYLVQPG